MRRFFYDDRTYNAVRKQYWRARGGAGDQQLHHWLFPQRAEWVPQGVRNAGFNLFETSAGLNEWMGYAQSLPNYPLSGRLAAGAAEWGIKLAIPGSLVAGGYVGYEAGKAMTPDDQAGKTKAPDHQ